MGQLHNLSAPLPGDLSAHAGPVMPALDKPWYKDPFALLIAMIAMGFPLAAVITSFLGLPTNILTVGSRFLVAILAVLIFLLATKKRKLKIPPVLFILFMSIYLTRLIYDSYFQFNINAETAISYFLSTVFIPSVIISFSFYPYSKIKSQDMILYLGIIFLFITIFLRFSGVNDFVNTEVDEAVARQGFERLNPIALGFAASIIAAISLLRLISENKPIMKAFCLFVIVCSLYVLTLAASRGPIMALAGSLLVAFLVNKNSRSGTAMAVISGFSIIIFSFIDIDSLLQRTRIAGVGVDVNSIARLEYYSEAWDAFLSDPLLGSSFELPISGGWPHNMWLEALMALGLFGGVAFLLLSVKGLVAAIRSLRYEVDPVAICYLQAMIIGLFSGSIWGANVFWPCLAILLNQTRTTQDIDAFGQPVNG